MWLFTTEGFVSAVAHRNKSGVLLVRARRGEHLRALFPEAEIECTPHADYRFRAEITREVWLGKMLAQLAMIDYDNFKAAIPDAEYHDVCNEVWGTMHKLQPGSNPWKGGQMSPYNHY
jgi:hypothetical protein